MARLPYPDQETAPVAVREALAALPPLNIFRMLAHAETAFRPFLRFGGAILGQLQLDPRLRELAILQVAAQSDAHYEWVQHVAIARQVGVSDEQIEAVKRGELRTAPALGDDSRAVLLFTEQVVAGPRVDKETFGALGALLSPREVVELLLTIGEYLMLARVMTTLELEIDAAVGDQVVQAVDARR